MMEIVKVAVEFCEAVFQFDCEIISESFRTKFIVGLGVELHLASLYIVYVYAICSCSLTVLQLLVDACSEINMEFVCVVVSWNLSVLSTWLTIPSITNLLPALGIVVVNKYTHIHTHTPAHTDRGANVDDSYEWQSIRLMEFRVVLLFRAAEPKSKHTHTHIDKLAHTLTHMPEGTLSSPTPPVAAIWGHLFAIIVNHFVFAFIMQSLVWFFLVFLFYDLFRPRPSFNLNKNTFYCHDFGGSGSGNGADLRADTRLEVR